jgi:hypothetical protein
MTAVNCPDRVSREVEVCRARSGTPGTVRNHPAPAALIHPVAAGPSGDHDERVGIVGIGFPEEYEMKSQLTRALTVLVAVTSVALAGVGVAAADGPGGSGSSSTTSVAAEVQTLHDGLAARADNGDVPGTQATLGELEPLLTELAEGERYTIQAEARNTAATAKEQTAEARKGVDELAAQTQARQGLPPVAGLLNALVQRVLLSLSVLANDLLGGLAVPVG